MSVRDTVTSFTTLHSGTVARQHWRVNAEPHPTALRIRDTAEAEVQLIPKLGGEYRIIHVAEDAKHQLSACETVLTVDTSAYALWVELLVDRRVVTSPVTDLHVLHPDATQWFDPDWVCRRQSCPEWNAGYPRESNNLPDWMAIRHDDPIITMGATYGVGVRAPSDAEVTVRIDCDGERVGEFGPQVLTRLPQGEVPLWRVTEVQMDQVGCRLTPVAPPEIISSSDAQFRR